MNIMLISGNPKKTGFIVDCLNLAQEHLQAKSVTTDRLDLARADIKDCLGCFHCLATGDCVIRDGMDDIAARMLAADGLVVASPVRNGNVTALYKRFFERITYRLGFPLLLEHKHTLAICSVGMAGGKGINRKLVGLQETMHARLSGYLFFRVGIPSRKTAEQVRPYLTQALDKLLADIQAQAPRGLSARLSFALDRWVMASFMLKKSPQVYANVVRHWRDKGYLA